VSCGNLPPRVAFSILPTLPSLPTMVDADRWLDAYDGHSFVRRVQQGGSVTIANVPYSTKAALVGRQVALRVDAAAGQFVVEAAGQVVQRLAINGLERVMLPFATFVDRLCADMRVVKRIAQVRAVAARLQ
jgi:hypothetical protein